MRVRRTRPGKGVQRGLTLIELMIVVAVLAILATIAIPTYDRYVTSARRSDGRGGAMAIAHAEERHFSIYQSYTASFEELRDRAGLEASLVVSADKAMSPKGYYALTVTAGTTFTVTATPERADAECTSLSLTSAGIKSGQPTPNKCW